MPKFSLEKTVNAKRDDIFKALSNFEDYQRLLPQHFPSVRIRSVRSNVSVVEEHMMLGDTELLIMAKHVVQKPVLHEVFVIGGDVKGSHIRQRFVETNNETKILVDVDWKFKGRLKISKLFSVDSLKTDYEKILDDSIRIARD